MTMIWKQSSLSAGSLWSSWSLSRLTQVMVADVVGTAGVVVRVKEVVERTTGVEVRVGRNVLGTVVVILVFEVPVAGLTMILTLVLGLLCWS